MDFTTAFKSEVFKPLVTLVIPGFIASSSWMAVVIYRYLQIKVFWDEHPSIFVSIVMIVIVTFGLALEEVGSLIELGWGEVLNDKDEWREYLSLKVDSKFVGQRYLSSMVLRLKFELSMAPALFVSMIGLVVFNFCNNVFTGFEVAVLSTIEFLLCVYLLFESYLSARVCFDTRKAIIKGYEPHGQAASSTC